MTINKIHIRPKGSLQILTQQEASQLCDSSSSGLNEILRSCALAVLNTGNSIDNGLKLLELNPDFDIRVTTRGRGVEIILTNPPLGAFVDGELVEGLKEHLFAVVRDLAYIRNDIQTSSHFDNQESFTLTNAVFHILRNAKVLKPDLLPNMVVCWGGHAISQEEYDYGVKVGYELGIRKLDICTGCGPGVMKAPMKGAIAGHHNQRNPNPRYLGISEPGIIAAEAPNEVVNELVIMPDIEKRLESFVRVGHAILIFPGGPGTLEEILYILSILLHPKNAGRPYPVVLTGDHNSEFYFEQIKQFICATIGPIGLERIKFMIDQPVEVAQFVKQQMSLIHQDRKQTSDAYYFNWLLHIDHDLQLPFEPTHENMRQLNLCKNQEPHALAAQLRKAFSGIVSGNVKAEGIKAIDEFGPFQLTGDPEIMQALDDLLTTLVQQKRMKMEESDYRPCYEIVSN